MASASSINAEVKETAICTWTIDAFSNVNGQVNYQLFYAPTSKNKFFLYLSPNNPLFDINHVYICLYYNTIQTELPLKYRVSILDANGHKQYTREYTWNYSKSGYVNSNYNVTSYISRDKCNELLVNGSLKIYCEVDVLKSKPQPAINLHVKETATLTWSIAGYRNLNYKVGSSKFSAPTSKEQFDLSLTPNNTTLFNMYHDYICLHYTGNQTELALQYRVSILDANGHKQYTREYTWNYSKSDYLNSEYNVTNYIRNDKCKQLAVNGSLKIYCEVNVLETKVQPLVKPKMKETSTQTMIICENSNSNYKAGSQFPAMDIFGYKEPNSILEINETFKTFETLKDLLENREFSDFSFMVGSKEFRVHKAILAIRSKVFRAMFITDLEREKQNRLKINDIDVEVFEELLRYIYTNKIPNFDKYASELFKAADKYQLEHLKSICEQSLGSSLTTESVTAVLQLADLHQVDHLRSKCIGFITNNSAAVIATEGWKQLRKNRIELVAEMLENMIISGKKYYKLQFMY